MNAEQLYHQLQKFNEPKGFYFNRDMEKTMFLLDALLRNKARYGYMCCPCRLSREDAKADRDIICPCDYREADVLEFGSCYCQLYVAKAWNEGMMPEVYIPERRPEEKF